MRVQKPVLLLLALLTFSTLFVAPAAADHETEEEQQTGILGGLADTLSDFTEGKTLTEILKDTLYLIFFEPFIRLAEALLKATARLITSTPSVHPNPVVEDIHSDVLLVTLLLSSLAFIIAGLLHMIGPVLGITYGQVRKILPRIILALAFSTVSLPLLQLGVEFTRALTIAFEPDFFESTFTQRMGISTGLVLAYVIQAPLLLAVAVIFAIRQVYILFVAAISPLLALAWSLPRIKKYADKFIGGFFAALLIAPLDMLVLKFSFALLSGSGTTAIQGVSNWVIGIASLVLLLLVPKQVWNASQTAIGFAYIASGGLKQRYHRDDQEGEFDEILDEQEKERLRERRDRRGKSSAAEKYDWGDD